MPSQRGSDYREALGRAVALRRNQLQLTQEQLALRSGLHQRWISNIETGKRNPSYGSLRRLASALDLKTSQLIASAERAEAPASALMPD
jgi:transcriptional regulator with XRE-family HTH domain